MQSERRMGRTRQKNKNETLIIKSHEIWVSVNIYRYICIHIFEYKETFFFFSSKKYVTRKASLDTVRLDIIHNLRKIQHVDFSHTTGNWKTLLFS